ncbi:type VI secretion system baseplate subunit TssE, partial [Photobacterium damselae]
MSYIALEDSAYGVSLFERLEADSVNRTITQGPEPALVLDSIKRNISQLLNSRIGESLSAPELGLVDSNDATLG